MFYQELPFGSVFSPLVLGNSSLPNFSYTFMIVIQLKSYKNVATLSIRTDYKGVRLQLLHTF